MEAAANDLQIKLTVTKDEHPELFKVLRAITEPRRRTRRLKELAATGLLVERGAGVALAPVSPQALPPAAGEGGSQDLLGDALGVALWEEKAD